MNLEFKNRTKNLDLYFCSNERQEYILPPALMSFPQKWESVLYIFQNL